jgi:hypothetical protein
VRSSVVIRIGIGARDKYGPLVYDMNIMPNEREEEINKPSARRRAEE